ncbi:MAG: hypothetical protein Q8R69_17775 [Telluria sp.]|nr:hypothetical protein [Telluria sp.]
MNAAEQSLNTDEWIKSCFISFLLFRKKKGDGGRRRGYFLKTHFFSSAADVLAHNKLLRDYAGNEIQQSISCRFCLFCNTCELDLININVFPGELDLAKHQKKRRLSHLFLLHAAAVARQLPA